MLKKVIAILIIGLIASYSAYSIKQVNQLSMLSKVEPMEDVEAQLRKVCTKRMQTAVEMFVANTNLVPCSDEGISLIGIGMYIQTHDIGNTGKIPLNIKKLENIYTIDNNTVGPFINTDSDLESFQYDIDGNLRVSIR